MGSTDPSNTFVFCKGFSNDTNLNYIILDAPNPQTGNIDWHVLRRTGLEKFKNAIEHGKLSEFTLAWNTSTNFINYNGAPPRGKLSDSLAHIYYMDVGSGAKIGNGKDLGKADSFEVMATSAAPLTVLTQWLALPSAKVADKPTDFKDGQYGADIKT